MNEEELERLHLEIAISESLKDSSNSQTFSSPEELAFFSDLSLDTIKKEPSLSKSGSSSGTAAKITNNKPASSLPTGKPSSSSNSKPSSNSPSPVRPPQPTSKPNSSSSSKPSSTLASSASLLLNSFGSAVASMYDTCPTCNKICDFGRFKVVQGKKYHERCFVCVACGNEISGEFAPRGEPQQPYHIECAKMLFTPICSVCSDNVTQDYLKHPFFEEEVYCCTHIDQPSCFACGKKVPLPSSKREKFTDLNDGRTLCPRCASTIIMDSNEVKNIYLKIVDYMENWQGLVLPPGMKDVPIFAVDVQFLNHEQQSLDGKGICCTEGTCRGLTMSRRGEIPQMSGGSVHFDRRTGTLRVVPTTVRVEEVREVTAVLILYGLPEEQATSIIAHEAMHVWLKLTKGMPFNMESKLEEGLCQVMAYMYLEHVGQQRSTGRADGMTEKEYQAWKETELLRSYLCHAIENDRSTVYGDGFREAIQRVKAWGLHEVLDYVKSSGSLPAV